MRAGTQEDEGEHDCKGEEEAAGDLIEGGVDGGEAVGFCEDAGCAGEGEGEEGFPCLWEGIQMLVFSCVWQM